MRKSWIDLIWPVAGLNRSSSYQKQPPFTTPDALNVRPDEQSEYRERGGSRPGLGLSLRTLLPGPIRMLGKVAILRTEWPANHIPIYGGQLNGGITVPVWTLPGTYVGSSSAQGNGAYLKGTSFGAEIPITYYDARDINKPYEVSVFLKPPVGGAMSGSATIYIALPDAATDPEVDGVIVTLSFGTSAYLSSIYEYISGVEQPPADSPLYTEGLGLPGTFAVRVTPATKLVEVFFRRQKLHQTNLVGSFSGHRSAFRVNSSDESILASKFKSDYEWDDTKTRTNRSARRDILIAVSEGNLYQEDSADSMTLKVSGKLNPDAQLTWAEREQLMYIADHGPAISGSASGVIAGASYNTLQDVAKNFTTLGVTSDFAIQLISSDYSQNEKQTVSLYNSDGGTFRLGFRGEFTAPIAEAASLAVVKSSLEALSTVDTVTVTGTPGTIYTVEFEGTLAGLSLELMAYIADGLTDSGGGTPSMEIASIQSGAGDEYIFGSYQITSVAGDTITFSPAIPVSPDWVGDITTVTYSVVRAPKVYDPQTGVMTAHSASLGTIPAGCRLVAKYSDRIVYASSDITPHVWYMSRQGFPNDWDFTQEDSASAIQAQASIGGQIADPITALIPHGDECLVVACYNSLWIIRGDPGYGGTQDRISRKIGIVGPSAWCNTADDMCIFLSPDGLYGIPAGCHGVPTSLSREPLPDELIGLNQERDVVTMEFDTINRGVHIFTSKHDSSEASHWWFDWEAKSFWRVKLQTAHEPFSLHERVAWDDVPVVLLGCRDGYIRNFSRDFEVDDESYEIESYVVLGPWHLDRGGYREGIVESLDITTGSDSGPIDWELRVGDGAESSYKNAPRESGSLVRAGLNYRSRPMARGVAATLKLINSGTQRWFVDRVIASMRSAGSKRVR